MRAGARLLGWVVALLLAAYSLRAHERPGAGDTDSLTRRLCGPFAELAARGQWVRVHGAMLAGRPDLVFQRAEVAFELDRGATEGWLFLARHLFYDRASQRSEPEPRRRAAWMSAALDVAERGEQVAREPGRLALWSGLALVRMASEEELIWPPTAAGPAGPAERRRILEQAARDFERAADAGEADAAGLGSEARRLAELMRRP